MEDSKINNEKDIIKNNELFDIINSVNNSVTESKNVIKMGIMIEIININMKKELRISLWEIDIEKVKKVMDKVVGKDNNLIVSLYYNYYINMWTVLKQRKKIDIDDIENNVKKIQNIFK